MGKNTCWRYGLVRMYSQRRHLVLSLVHCVVQYPVLHANRDATHRYPSQRGRRNGTMSPALRSRQVRSP